MRVDLHLHSCLSPCGDDQMRPDVLVGFSALGGVELAALTDHNSVRNCPAAAAAAAEYGIGFIPGAEVTTSEDVHCVCLLPTLEAAMAFGAELERHCQQIPNRPDIFGRQTNDDRKFEGEIDQGNARFGVVGGECLTILDHGHLAFTGTVEALARKMNGDAPLDIRLAEGCGEGDVESAVQALRETPGVSRNNKTVAG